MPTYCSMCRKDIFIHRLTHLAQVHPDFFGEPVD